MRTTAAAILMCAASGASVFGQASFTPYFSAGGTLQGLSGDGTRLVVEVTGGTFSAPTISISVLYKEGGSRTLYANTGRAVISGLNYDGSAAWGATDALGGNVRRVTGSTAASSTSYFPGFPTSVSDDENIVVGYNGSGVGFMWDRSTGPSTQTLQPLAGGVQARANGVSPHGVYAAGYSGTSVGAITPTRWRVGQASAPFALAVPAGYTTARGVAASDTGLTVGYVDGVPNTSQTRAVVWDNAGNARLLPSLGTRGTATDISGDGSVIVGYENVVVNGNSRKAIMVWRNGVREDVLDLLTGAGVNMAGQTLDDGLAISTDGTVIVGRGYNPSTMVYFATLPPACVADVGGAGGVPGRDGQLDNNDFIAFIGHFFANDPRADVGVAGGLRGADGVFDNNDFIQFVSLFFGGCG